MFYNLLGRAVWYGLKVFVRRKYRRAPVRRSLLAGATVAVAIAIGVALLRARSAE